MKPSVRDGYREHLQKVKGYFFTIILSFVVVCSFRTTTVQAQTKVLIKDSNFTFDAKKAIDSLYNRNNSAADEILKPWIKKHPDHPIWNLWDAMEVWWEVLEDLADHSKDRELISMMQQADYEAGQILRPEPGHPDALIIRAVANGYVARHHANRDDWLSSVQVGRKAYQAYQQLLKAAPELPDNLFAKGMIMYYSAYIPQAYPVVRAVSWFFPEGDKEKGLKTLEKAIEKAVFARAEARYFLGNILLNYENDYEEAKQQFMHLVDQYPNNSYYRRQVLRTLAQLNEYSELISFSKETYEYLKEYDLPSEKVLETEIYYWMGRAEYHTGDWFTALSHFKKSLDVGEKLVNRKSRDVYILSAYFAGRSLEILDQNEEAKKFYRIAADQDSFPEARERSRERLKLL